MSNNEPLCMKDGCVFALLTCLITFCYAKFAMSFSRGIKSRTACENQLDIPHYNKKIVTLIRFLVTYALI